MEKILKSIIEIELKKQEIIDCNSIIINNIYKNIVDENFTEYLIFCFYKDLDENPYYAVFTVKVTNKEFSEIMDKVKLDKIGITLMSINGDWATPARALKRLLAFCKNYEVIKEYVKL